MGFLKLTWPTRKSLHLTGMELPKEPPLHSVSDWEEPGGEVWPQCGSRGAAAGPCCPQLQMWAVHIHRYHVLQTVQSYIPFPPSFYPYPHLAFFPLLLSVKKSCYFSGPKLISPCVPANLYPPFLCLFWILSILYYGNILKIFNLKN